jgi:hypothetical protein
VNGPAGIWGALITAYYAGLLEAGIDPGSKPDVELRQRPRLAPHFQHGPYAVDPRDIVVPERVRGSVDRDRALQMFVRSELGRCRRCGATTLGQRAMTDPFGRQGAGDIHSHDRGAYCQKHAATNSQSEQRQKNAEGTTLHAIRKQLATVPAAL